MHIQSNSTTSRDLGNRPKLPDTGLFLVVRKTFAEVVSAEEVLEQSGNHARARSHDAVFRGQQSLEEWPSPRAFRIIGQVCLVNMSEDGVLAHSVDADEETCAGSCSGSESAEDIPALTSPPSSQDSSPRTPLTTTARIFTPQPQPVAVAHQAMPANLRYAVHLPYPMVGSSCASYGAQYFPQHCHDERMSAINETEEEDKKKKRRSRSKACSYLIDPKVPEIPAEQRTTVMMRNIPYCFKREMLWALLDSQGFRNRYDFVYLPKDFTSEQSLGYAFVNLVSNEDAPEFFEVFTGFDRWGSVKSSGKPCTVDWGHPYQGFDAHVNRYRNSPVMHHEVPADAKPAIFIDGCPVAFPAPTKNIEKPRWKHNFRCGSGSHKEDK